MLPISMIFLGTVYYALYRYQSSLLTNVEQVNFIIEGMLTRSSETFLNEKTVIQKCQENNIPQKRSALAIESLEKIDGLIYRKDDAIYKIANERYFPVLNNPESDRDFIEKTIIQKTKIEEFNRKYGLNIRPATTRNKLLERMKLKRK